MADGQLVRKKRFGHGRNQFREFQALRHILRVFAYFGCDARDIEAMVRQTEQRPKSVRLFDRMDVLPLPVLDNLGQGRIGVAELNDADRNAGRARQLRRAETARTGHDLKSFVGDLAYQQRRKNALRLDAFSKLLKARLVVAFAGIRRRLDKLLRNPPPPSAEVPGFDPPEGTGSGDVMPGGKKVR